MLGARCHGEDSAARRRAGRRRKVLVALLAPQDHYGDPRVLVSPPIEHPAELRDGAGRIASRRKRYGHDRAITDCAPLNLPQKISDVVY
jgi:hypothetical protein